MGWGEPGPEWVHRELQQEVIFSSSLRALRTSLTGAGSRDRHNIRCLEQYASDVDAIVFWGMWNVGKALAVAAETSHPGRVFYYLGDYWPTLPNHNDTHLIELSRRGPAQRFSRLIELFVARRSQGRPVPEIAFDKTFVCSNFLRKELSRTMPVFEKAELIYGAAPTTQFLRTQPETDSDPMPDADLPSPSHPKDDVLRILWAGRLVPDKGAHTAVEALGLLADHPALHKLELTIVGTGPSDNREKLQSMIESYGLESQVKLIGRRKPSAMPQLFAEADIFLFTSIWPEPFGRVIVEAMAAEALVIGSRVGAAPEIIEHDHTGYLYEPGDAAGLSQLILQTHETPETRAEITRRARKVACEKFDTQRMLDELEARLLSEL